MSFWTQAREEELTALWNADKSSQQIADLWGISRSAVVGKVHRLRFKGVVLRTDHETTRASKTAIHRRKVVLEAKIQRNVRPGVSRETFLAKLMAEAKNVPPPKVDPADVGRKTLLELADSGECKYAVGENRPHMFCAEETVPGMPYCQRHLEKCWAPLPQPTGRGFSLPPLTARIREPVG